MKIASFSERGSFTEKNVQCPTPHGHADIQLFQKFQKIADGGPRRKTEKFCKSKK